MDKIQKLEAKGYRRGRNFKTEQQAKHYAKTVGVGGRDAVVEPQGNAFWVMIGVKTAAVVIALKDLPKGLSWNAFLSKNLPAYKETQDHASAMKHAGLEWVKYKELHA